MPRVDPSEIAKRVRQARARARLTQAILAEAAGVTDETVSRIERGAYEPTLSTMVALADALGVGIEQLLGRAPGDARKRRAGSAPAVRRLADLAGRLDARGQRALLAAAEAMTEYGGQSGK